jgi:transcriptional regulator with XRE-family HTH domain
MGMREQNLSDETKVSIQNKLHHYLVRYRTSASMTQTQISNNLGYSLSAYRAFERQFSEDNRIVSAIEILKQFADLEKQDVSEFVTYLLSGTKQSQNSAKGLRKWEQELLETLRHTDQSLRRSWSESIMKFSKKDLNILLDVQTQIARIKDKLVLSSFSILAKGQSKQNP